MYEVLNTIHNTEKRNRERKKYGCPEPKTDSSLKGDCTGISDTFCSSFHR
jgi:hypothetical protein